MSKNNIKIIEETECKVVISSKEHTHKEHKIWVITKHPDKDLIGLPIYLCEMPSAKNYPVDTIYTQTIKVPK